jgi:hypothetical protein
MLPLSFTFSSHATISVTVNYQLRLDIRYKTTGLIICETDLNNQSNSFPSPIPWKKTWPI